MSFDWEFYANHQSCSFLWWSFISFIESFVVLTGLPVQWIQIPFLCWIMLLLSYWAKLLSRTDGVKASYLDSSQLLQLMCLHQCFSLDQTWAFQVKLLDIPVYKPWFMSGLRAHRTGFIFDETKPKNVLQALIDACMTGSQTRATLK